ncbi:MAG: SDR family oxidoreductase [Burkholderiaceae bacterium]
MNTEQANMPTAAMVGASLCHGAAIAARLEHDGYAVLPLQAGDATVLPADGSVALLVINTPVVRTGLRFADIGDADFDAAVQEQLFDTVATMQAVLPRMGAGARIVLVGARGHLGAWGGAHHMAASAAVVALVRSLALELAPQGIRVNMVAADFVERDTPGTPASAAIARAVSYLGDADTGVSGETLLMDGNTGLRMSESRKPRTGPRDATADAAQSRGL